MRCPDKSPSHCGPHVPGGRKPEAGGSSRAYLRSPGRRVTQERRAWWGAVWSADKSTFTHARTRGGCFKQRFSGPGGCAKGDAHGWGEAVYSRVLGTNAGSREQRDWVWGPHPPPCRRGNPEVSSRPEPQLGKERLPECSKSLATGSRHTETPNSKCHWKAGDRAGSWGTVWA